MCQSKTKPTSRLIAATVAGAALGAMLGGCSNIYMDRRDKIGFSGGDAIAANEAMQTSDPWPAHSGNTHLAFDGQKMQGAAERYRTGTPWVPVDVGGYPVGTANPSVPQTPPVQLGVGQVGGTPASPVPGITPGTTTTTTTVVTSPSGGTTSSSSTTH